MKLLYFHVPKTAGSSINNFFSRNIKSHHFHIESVKNLNPDFCKRFQFLSGHVSYNRMNSMLNLREWITFATFREPLSYTLSHLKWVRKLADEGEEERFNEHPEIFQKISLKMTEFDFSQAEQIASFIKWLESIDFYYFHNTQTLYMNSSRDGTIISDKQMHDAISNLHKIDFVGVQESLDEFMGLIGYEFGWEIDQNPRDNVNENNYGFDMNDEATRQVLLPLYEKDLILYEEAKKLYAAKKELYDIAPKKDIIGYVDRVTSTEIVGWVRSKESLQKVELELKVGDTLIQTAKANLYRQDLKTKGLHPTGLCGFKFSLINAIDEECCKIYIKDTNIELKLPKKKAKKTLPNDIDGYLSKAINSVNAKKKRCILHIGLHKTGSSSIQNNLFRFLVDSDYLYLDLGTPNHSVPIYSLFTDKPEDYYIYQRKALKKEEIKQYNANTVEKFVNNFQSSSSENIIISGEDISVLSLSAITKLKDFLDKFFHEIKVVYIRNPHEAAISFFQQLVNGGRKKDFLIEKGCYPDYRNKIQKFDKVFGIPNVDVLYFNKNHLYKNDVVLDFCHHIGIKFDEKNLQRVNESVSKEVLSLLYVYYKYGPGFGIGNNVIKENALLRDKLSSIGKTKISFSSKVTNPIISKNLKDIQWVQERSGIVLLENITPSSDDIEQEEDLIELALSSLQDLRKLVHMENIPDDINAKEQLMQVVDLVHLLRNQVVQ